MNHIFHKKRVLVTGACGTVGSELVRLLLKEPAYDPEEVIGLDNNESELFFLEQRYDGDPRARFYIADIRDRDELCRRFQGIDVVLHAAALKHVLLCERSPSQAVRTNILGVENVIAAATENGVERVVFTSSDKAVNPTNVMGTSKLMGERLITAANSHKRSAGPIFFSTRFGNILGSRGSVIPLFHRQIRMGGPVTLTDPAMTRFIMTLEEAVRLVLDSVALAKGGEVFVTKMPVARIADLAEVMIEELGPRYGHSAENIELRTVGCKPGEKLYEELINEEEVRRTIELERYFVVFPAFRAVYEAIDYTYEGESGVTPERPYNSGVEPPMSKEDLRHYLRRHKLLEPCEAEPLT